MKTVKSGFAVAGLASVLAACGGEDAPQAAETCQRSDVSISMPDQQLEQDTACAMEVSSELTLRFAAREAEGCQPLLVAVTELGSPVSRVNVNYTFDNESFSGTGIGLRSYLLTDRLSSHAIIGEFNPPAVTCAEASLKILDVTCQTEADTDGSSASCGDVVFENTELFQSFSGPSN